MILHILDLNHRCTRLFPTEVIYTLKIVLCNKILDIKAENESSSSSDAEMFQETPVSEYDQALNASQTYSSDVDLASSISSEIDAYLQWKITHLKMNRKDHLNWFRNGISHAFPNVFLAAKHYFMFLGTTVAIENAFSMTRIILRCDRMRMSWKKVEELMILTLNPDITVRFLASKLHKRNCKV